MLAFPDGSRRQGQSPHERDLTLQPPLPFTDAETTPYSPTLSPKLHNAQPLPTGASSFSPTPPSFCTHSTAAPSPLRSRSPRNFHVTAREPRTQRRRHPRRTRRHRGHRHLAPAPESSHDDDTMSYGTSAHVAGRAWDPSRVRGLSGGYRAGG
jgi:hypothetical protein